MLYLDQDACREMFFSNVIPACSEAYKEEFLWCCSQAATNANIRRHNMTCTTDSDFKCVLDSGTTICCNSDSDCPPKDNVKGKCRSPSGTGGTPYDYTCVWPPCTSNADCVDGTCCTADKYGPVAGSPKWCLCR